MFGPVWPNSGTSTSPGEATAHKIDLAARSHEGVAALHCVGQRRTVFRLTSA